MPKNLIQDVIPKDNPRSIKRIPLPPRRKTLSIDYSEPVQLPTTEDDMPVKKSRLWLWLIALVSVAVLAFISSYLFTGATVVVTPVEEALVIKSDFVAKRTGNSGELTYGLMTLSKEMSRSIPATKEEFVEEKAEGTIVIYNNFGTAVQRLVKNTRFETPEGLVYRILNSVDVPGKKTVDGKTIPGSIEAVVSAEAPGEKYNINLTDFTIPGFKGDPRYNGFYARSKNKMMGGFSGNKKIVDEKEVEQAREVMQKELKEKLIRDAEAQVPDGYVLFSNGFTAVFEAMPEKNTPNTVDITEKATFHFALFNTAGLTEEISKKLNKTGGAKIPNIKTLIFSLKNPNDASLIENGTLQFRLDGTVRFVRTFDEVQLKGELVNKARKNAEEVFLAYPGIKKAEIKIRPFWKMSFPSDPDDIRVVVVSEAQ